MVLVLVPVLVPVLILVHLFWDWLWYCYCRVAGASFGTGASSVAVESLHLGSPGNCTNRSGRILSWYSLRSSMKNRISNEKVLRGTHQQVRILELAEISIPGALYGIQRFIRSFIRKHNVCVSRLLLLPCSMADCTSILGTAALSQCDVIVSAVKLLLVLLYW